jgi:peptide-methionine (S)-S-oxide reductase
MISRTRWDYPFVALGCVVFAAATVRSLATGEALPAPVVDASLAATSSQQSAVLAGGCFWGVQSVFEHVRGVTKVVAGYSGGSASTAHSQIVETGTTGHAESVRVAYDASKITYGQILRIFFSVAHDPTELNRQGPDEGPQYRSVIFYADSEQQRIAQAYIAQLDQVHAFRRPIVTQVSALRAFYVAEPYHQDYAKLHPDAPYIVINDVPKIEHLREAFPDLYAGK